MNMNKKGMDLGSILIGIVIALSLLFFYLSFFTNIFDSAGKGINEQLTRTCNPDKDNIFFPEDKCACDLPDSERGNGYVVMKPDFIWSPQLFDETKTDILDQGRILSEADANVIIAYVTAKHSDHTFVEPIPFTRAVRKYLNPDLESLTKWDFDANVFCAGANSWDDCTPEMVNNQWFKQKTVKDESAASGYIAEGYVLECFTSTEACNKQIKEFCYHNDRT